MDDGRLYCRDEVRVMMRAILKLKGPQASSQLFKGIATLFFKGVPVIPMPLLKLTFSD
jgi:hypothetical protein